jgi:hypothetical protein
MDTWDSTGTLVTGQSTDSFGIDGGCGSGVVIEVKAWTTTGDDGYPG